MTAESVFMYKPITLSSFSAKSAAKSALSFLWLFHFLTINLLFEDKEEIKIHEMSLQDGFFNLIACGKKTIEIRLNDENRMKVKSGDIIKLSSLSKHEELEVDVINITRYESFEEVYSKINIQNLGLGEIT